MENDERITKGQLTTLLRLQIVESKKVTMSEFLLVKRKGHVGELTKSEASDLFKLLGEPEI